MGASAPAGSSVERVGASAHAATPAGSDRNPPQTMFLDRLSTETESGVFGVSAAAAAAESISGVRGSKGRARSADEGNISADEGARRTSSRARGTICDLVVGDQRDDELTGAHTVLL